MKTCNKNGVKRLGESCTLNNNCIYPKCMEDYYSTKEVELECLLSKVGDEVECKFELDVESNIWRCLTHSCSA